MQIQWQCAEYTEFRQRRHTRQSRQRRQIRQRRLPPEGIVGGARNFAPEEFFGAVFEDFTRL